LSALGDVLVVTVRKSFWASPEAEAWPRRVEARVLFGHSSNVVSSLLVFVRALAAILVRPPRVVLLGSVERTVPWFVRARRAGLLRGARLVVTNQLTLSPRQLEQVDAVIVHARAQAAALGEKGVFIRLPADGDLARAARAGAAADAGAFAGGGTDRDFASVIDAVRGTDVPLELVTFSPQTLGYQGPLPPNVRVRWRMSQDEFLARMARAAVVVVPLHSSASAHGQTTLVQALALGKPVVATRATGTVDYVEDGGEGTLVEAGDVEGYRRAIVELAGDEHARAAVAARAAERARELTYGAFADELRRVCESVLAE
jgi:glycosyltransferase involved in cell wall biosynthesis